jgi:RNA polymerase sigma-70 factor (ECF subfamily)
LEQLRLRPDDQAWRRFVDLYTPLIRHWLSRHGLQAADVDDLSQEVLAVVIRKLPEFEHNRRPGAFRTWLRTITAYRLGDFLRARRNRPPALGQSNIEHLLEQLRDPASDLSREWDRLHDRHVARRLLELIRPEFTAPTWEAFRLLVLEDTPAAAVAGRLGLSVNAVLIAKSRVLSRLRREVSGLLDD